MGRPAQTTSCDWRKDKLTRGRDLHRPADEYDSASEDEAISHPLGYFAGSFLVFRGVALSPAVVQKWTAIVNKSEYEHQIDDILYSENLELAGDPEESEEIKNKYLEEKT